MVTLRKIGTALHRHRKLCWVEALLLAVGLVSIPGWSQDGKETSGAVDSTPGGVVSGPVDVSSGHRRMVDFLRWVAEKTPDENPILGNRALRGFKAELDALSSDADPRERFVLETKIGQREMNQGNLEAAIDHLARAHDLANRQQERIGPKQLAHSAYRLGVGYLRQGETENCCLRHTPESCILPIQGGGIHTRQDGSRQAIEQFESVLKVTPESSPLYVKAKWLLNIAVMTIGAYPDEVPATYLIPPALFKSAHGMPRFENVAPGLGLDTFDLAGGAIVDDFNNDAVLDILVSTWDPDKHLKLFINNADGTFSERSAEANLEGLLGGFNLIQADYNNDGHLDVFVIRGAWLGKAGRIPNSLLRNNGDGTFTDVTFKSGLGDVHYPSQTAAWGDYDNDGDLDLFVGNEPLFESESDSDVDGFLGQESPATFEAVPCHLFRNDGRGRFTDVAKSAGVENRRFTKAVGWGDYNGDRFPDLYVSNLYQPNRLYRNNGYGTFTDVAEDLGVVRPMASFPTWFWDYDNDGVLDLVVFSYDWKQAGLAGVVASRLGLSIPFELTRLYRGDGNGGFEEVARQQGLEELTLPMGANFGDLDNDGYPDFYLGTGYPDYEALMPNVMVLNRQGKRFEDVTYGGGFGHLQKGHAVVFADVDNDGDQDVFEQIGGFYYGDRYGNALFENPGFGHRWITIQLVGVRSNRSAIGARIRAVITEDGKRRSIYRHVNSGGSFGANPLRQTLGLGRATALEQIEVFWPASGATQRFAKVEMDRIIRIVEGEEEIETLSLESFTLRR
jgi:hypothetical protein